MQVSLVTLADYKTLAEVVLTWSLVPTALAFSVGSWCLLIIGLRNYFKKRK